MGNNNNDDGNKMEEFKSIFRHVPKWQDLWFYQKSEVLERTFVTEGSIKERMHQSRTGYRQKQDKRLAELEQLVPQQQQLAETQAAYQDLKQRALKAYYQQQEEIERLKKLLKK